MFEFLFFFVCLFVLFGSASAYLVLGGDETCEIVEKSVI